VAKAQKQAKIARDLSELRDGLLRGRPRALGSDEGEEAFQQHKLLAAAVHRASELDRQDSESETAAWVRYLTMHYPESRNDAESARLLYGDWRSPLLKRDAPGPGIAITHGQSVIHWQRDQHGRLCLNLEDAWDDFATSVESFLEYLRGSSKRRKVVLARWRPQQWVVEPFVPKFPGAFASATVMDMPLSAAPGASASVSTSVTLTTSGARSITASAPPRKPES
jgi:hypothetical protein